MRPDAIYHTKTIDDNIPGNCNCRRHEHQSCFVDAKQKILEPVILLRHAVSSHRRNNQGKEHNRQSCHNTVEQVSAHGNCLIS